MLAVLEKELTFALGNMEFSGHFADGVKFGCSLSHRAMPGAAMLKEAQAAAPSGAKQSQPFRFLEAHAV